MKTLSVDPANPIDVAILRFLADADLKPKILETESFQEMARLLRAAPKNYQLPGVNRHEEGAYEAGYGGSGGSGGGSSGVGGVSSSSGSNSGNNMVHTMMQMNSIHNISAAPSHNLVHNNIDHLHHTQHHAMNANTHPVTNTTNTNTNTTHTTNPALTLPPHLVHAVHATQLLHPSTSAMGAHAALQAQHDAHKRARLGYTTSASVEAGVDSDSEESVDTLPQM